MRLHQFITENSYENKIKLRDNIKNNKIVQFYLKSKDYYLFRGIKQKINTYQYFNRRKDRTPRDTPIEIHNRLDDAFQKKFGWKVRSEGIFVAGEYSAAKHYGIPYLFIPLEPFEYVYSNKINDLYAHLEKEEYIVDKKISKYNHLDDDTIKEIVNTYKKNADLYDIIVNNSEVMFNCDKFILMDIYYFKSLWY